MKSFPLIITYLLKNKNAIQITHVMNLGEKRQKTLKKKVGFCSCSDTFGKLGMIGTSSCLENKVLLGRASGHVSILSCSYIWEQSKMYPVQTCDCNAIAFSKGSSICLVQARTGVQSLSKCQMFPTERDYRSWMKNNMSQGRGGEEKQNSSASQVSLCSV